MHAVTDPLRLGASVPQAAAILAAQRPAAVFTTGGYMAVPVLMAAAPLGIPVDPVGRQRHPRPGGPGDRPAGDRPRRVVPGDVRGALEGGARAAVLPHRHADPRHPRRRSRGRPPTTRHRSVRAGPARLRWLAGGPPVQRRRVRGAAAHWSSASPSSTWPARTATRPRWPNARHCPRRSAAATVRTRSCATRCCRRWPPRTWSWAGRLVDAGRGDRPGPADDRGPVSACRRHQRANAKVLTDAGAARSVEDADFDATTLLEAAAILDDPAAHLAMSAAARAARPAGRRRRGHGPRPRRRPARAPARSGRHRAALQWPRRVTPCRR